MLRRLFLTTSVALVAAVAANAEDVNVYTTRQPELVQPLFDRFTEETGITVNVAFLNKGLTERLLAEGKRSPADLVMTVDIARLAEIVEAGVTQPVVSPALAAHIPAAFRDPGNQWFGLTSRARVVFASRERVKPGDLTTYEDLADPKWQGRICIRPGTHAYNLALIAAMIAHDGEAATKSWLEGFRANLARKPQGNDRAQIKAVWAGECDIAIGNTYYLGEMLKDPEQAEWAAAVNVVFPQFAGGGTHVNLSGVAMTAAAPHPEAALKLMEFLAAPEAQSIYAEINNEYPVLPGAPLSDIVAGWGTFTPDDLNMMAVAGHRAAALRLVEEVNFDY